MVDSRRLEGKVDGFTELYDRLWSMNALMRIESQGGKLPRFIMDYCLKGRKSFKIDGCFVTGRSALICHVQIFLRIVYI